MAENLMILGLVYASGNLCAYSSAEKGQPLATYHWKLGITQQVGRERVDVQGDRRKELDQATKNVGHRAHHLTVGYLQRLCL